MLATDNSISDPRELRQIEEAILGPKGQLHVRFIDHATRDYKAEAEQQERIKNGADEVARPFFKRKAYIEKRHEGQKDYIAKPATEKDKREFAKQWEAFQIEREQPPKHSISLLPGQDVCSLALFGELNVYYIEDFLTFVEKQPEILDIFDELKPLHEAAKRWRTFMKPRLKMVNGEAKNADD